MKKEPPRRFKTPTHKAHRRKHNKPHVGSGAVKNEINVTPLVDVVLVLLIIFMVVTPMLSRGAKVELPETSHHDKKNDNGEQVIVTVAPDGTVWVEGDPVTNENFAEHMKLAMKKHTSGEVHVKGDRHLEYGVVRKVLERIHEAGAPSVALGTEEHKKEGP